MWRARSETGERIIIWPLFPSHDGAAPGAAYAVHPHTHLTSNLVLGPWDQLGTQARLVRTAVFIVEQAIDEAEEWDEWDAPSLHAIALDNTGAPIGTGRLLPSAFDSDPTIGHVGRMAVLAEARNVGVGGLILRGLMQAGREQGFKHIVLHAQKQVAHFYARHGFVAEGEEFLEVGIPHLTMRAPLL